MNKLKNIFLISIFFLLGKVGYTADENLINGITLNNLEAGTEIAVRDAWFLEYKLSTTDDIFTTERSEAKVKLWFDDSEKSFYGAVWQVDLTYDIALTKENGDEILLEGETLSVDFNPTNAYKDINLKIYDDEIYIKAVISNINAATLPSVFELPEDLHLDVELNANRYYNLDEDETASVSHSILDLGTGINKEIGVKWSYVEGAESYDLEWLFIDHPVSDLLGYPALSELTGPYSFRDASRVNVYTTNYNISLAYPRGLFIFRVRPVGKKVVDGEIVRIEGKWSIGNIVNPTTISSVEKFEHEGLLSNMNWQYQASFVEEGKRGEMIGIYDGSLKPRQDITINNADNTAIVSQTVYDYLGRPAISLLPVPEENKGLGYYSGRLTNDGGLNYYDYDDFDAIVDGTSKTDNPNSMAGLGANDHYSGGTAIGPNSDYVADAEDYPFARTTFTRDGTGRVKTQTAVGGSDIGANTLTGAGAHLMHYLYGTPTQEELYRLFGNEVGNASHYKKNATIDQNGQAHIQYLDLSGRVIATGLGGDAPSNLLEIDSYPESFDEITADLTINNTFNEDGELFISKRLIVPYTTTYDFVYSLGGITYEDECIIDYSSITMIPDVLYDVLIYVEDESNERVDLLGISHDDYDPVTKTLFIEATTAEADIPFSVSMGIGEYRINKVLSLNEAYIELLKKDYYLNQDCYEFTEVAGNPCNPSCEDLCFSGYGYVNAEGQRVYQNEIGVDIAFETIVSGEPVYNYYPLSDAEEQLTAILTAIAECETNCEGGPKFTLDPCDLKLNRLKADMSPGGQYFDNTPFASFDPIDGDINGWLSVEIGLPADVGLGDFLSWGDLRENWEEEFVDDLVEFHPEYCIYALTCGAANHCSVTYNGEGDVFIPAPGCDPDIIPSEYNYLINTTLVAEGTPDEYLFNPTNITSSIGFGTTALNETYQPYADALPSSQTDPYILCRPHLMTELNDALLKFFEATTTTGSPVNHSIWYVMNDPENIHLGSGTYSDETVAYYEYLHGDGTDEGLIGAGVEQLSKYQFFKSQYLFFRELVEYESIENFDSATLACIPGCERGVLPTREESPENNGLTENGFLIHYPPNPVFETHEGGITLEEIETEISDVCTSQCEDFAVAWLSDLGTCASTADLEIAKNYLIQICSTSCDEDNLQGNSVTTPGIVGDWGTLTSFDQVIDELNARSGSGCAYITHPVEDPSETFDDCNCNSVTDFVTNYYNLIGITIPETFNLSTDLVSGIDYTTDFLDFLEENLTEVEETEGITVSITMVQNWLDDCETGTLLSEDLLDAFVCAEIPDLVDLSFLEEKCGDLLDATENFYQENLVNQQIEEGWKTYLANYTQKAFEDIKTREVFTMTFDLHEYHYTLFYYDQAGNLVKTIPPAGILNATLDAAQIQLCKDHLNDPLVTDYQHPISYEFITNYKYNSLQQLIEQITPDGGKTEYWYDALGRLIASQNARQAEEGKYSYTIYDNIGRVIEAGEINGISIGDDSFTPMSDEIAKNITDYNTWIESGDREEVMRTIYNEYQEEDIVSGLDGEVSSEFGIDTEAERVNLRGRIGSTVYYYGEFVNTELGRADFDHAEHFKYDYAGNVKSILQENKLLSEELSDEDALNALKFVRTDYTYDLISGNVHQVDYQKGKQDQFHYQYEYDANNRLTTSYSSKDGEIWEKESKNFYYAHGPLARQEVGDQIVQACDYVYTVNGWLKAVNSSVNNANNDAGKDGKSGTQNEFVARDAMGFSLHYYENDYIATGGVAADELLASISNPEFGATTHDLYNGNISQMITSLNNINEVGLGVLANKYRYDQLQRIKSSNVFESKVSGGNDIRNTNSITSTSAEDKGNYETNYTFDGNGNLLTLNRSEATASSMDELTYNYDFTIGAKTNQLLSVDDLVSIDFSEVDVDEQMGGNYSYDPIGQLKIDKSNDISNIEWTVTGKVKRIEYDNGLNPDLETNVEAVTFEYDAMGNRVSKSVDITTYEDPGTSGPLIVTHETTTTYYMLDASGNVLATYDHKKVEVEGTQGITETTTLNEHHLYGSKRLGIVNRTTDMHATYST